MMPWPRSNIAAIRRYVIESLLRPTPQRVASVTATAARIASATTATIAHVARRVFMTLPHQRGGALRPDAHHLDRRADQRFDPLHVRLRLFRKLLEPPAAGEVPAPRGQRLVNRLDFRQRVHIGAEIVERRAAILVARADLHVIEPREHVDEHQRDVRYA